MKAFREVGGALHEVLKDWLQRRPKQLRETLPPRETMPILRFIQEQGCAQTAPKTVECGKWSQRNPDPVGLGSYLFDRDLPQGPFMLTSEFVCANCKHPVLNHEVLITKLGLTRFKEGFSVRTWQRYVNEGTPVPTDTYRRAVVNAFFQGWLSFVQLQSIFEGIVQLDAARNGLRALWKRYSERKSFRERGQSDISETDLEREIRKQLCLRDREATHIIAQRIKQGDLPDECRQILQNLIFDRDTNTSRQSTEKKS